MQSGLRNHQPKRPTIPNTARFWALPNTRQAKAFRKDCQIKPHHHKGAFCQGPMTGATYMSICTHMFQQTGATLCSSTNQRSPVPVLALAAQMAGEARLSGERKVQDQPSLLARCSTLSWRTRRSDNQYRVADRELPGHCPARLFVPTSTCDLFSSPCKENEGRGNERTLSLLAAFFKPVATDSFPLLGGFTPACKCNGSMISMENRYLKFLRRERKQP